jgi:hypothetical protein
MRCDAILEQAAASRNVKESRANESDANNVASSLFQVGKYEGKLALSCPATQ